jgi:glycine cleavage system transcriptional repressor
MEHRTGNRFVVVVMSRDRVGIVRDVTARLEQYAANIERISQTVVMNYFTLTLVVTFPEPHSVEDVKQLFESAGRENEFSISVKRFEAGAENKAAVSDAELFILTITGKDRPGIISQMSGYLAGKGINIIDLNAQKSDDGYITLISELAVPQDMSASQIQLDIEVLSQNLGLSATLQHENIFKATNDIKAPITFFY